MIAVELGKWIVTIVVTVTAPIWFLPYAAIRGLYEALLMAHKRIWRRD